YLRRMDLHARYEKTHSVNLRKSWLITEGLFLIIQLLLIAIDDTFIERNLNDRDNMISRIGAVIIEARLATVLITPYSFPLFKLLVTLQIIAILIQALQDMINIRMSKK